MGMMTLGLTAGEEVVVSANGDDEQTAMDDIVKVFKHSQCIDRYCLK